MTSAKHANPQTTMSRARPQTIRAVATVRLPNGKTDRKSNGNHETEYAHAIFRLARRGFGHKRSTPEHSQIHDHFTAPVFHKDAVGVHICRTEANDDVYPKHDGHGAVQTVPNGAVTADEKQVDWHRRYCVDNRRDHCQQSYKCNVNYMINITQCESTPSESQRGRQGLKLAPKNSQNILKVEFGMRSHVACARLLGDDGTDDCEYGERVVGVAEEKPGPDVSIFLIVWRVRNTGYGYPDERSTAACSRP